MKPRARSVYFSKFILNSLSLFRSPNGAAENIVIGRLVTPPAAPRGHRRERCRQRLRLPEGADREFWRREGGDNIDRRQGRKGAISRRVGPKAGPGGLLRPTVLWGQAQAFPVGFVQVDRELGDERRLAPI